MGEDDGRSTPLDFNRFAPYPPEWADMDREFFRWVNAGDLEGEPPVHAYSRWGLAWCFEHWGTKWNARDPVVTEGDERDGEYTAVYRFDTAWSPPTALVLTASERFPDLYFDLGYFEPLGDFSGTFRCLNGVVTVNESGPCTHEVIE